MIDRLRFPRVARYLDDLPVGLESYPEALVKGAVVRAAVLDRRVLRASEVLPPPLAAWFASPPLATTWVRSVHAQSVFLAIADDHAMNDDQFGDWTYRLQKQLYGGPLYRALAVVTTPPMLLTGTRMRWTAIHRGTDLEVTVNDSNETATVALTFPSNLYTRLNLVGFARGFQAVIELSNATSASVTLAGSASTKAKFDVRWRAR